MKTSNTTRKLVGGGTNLKREPSDVKGNASAEITTPNVAKSKGQLGLLL